MTPPIAASEPSAPVPQSGIADARAALRSRLWGTNINEKTLLATDYLNHFSEFVMLLDLIPDMPECLDDAAAWAPRGYREHFRDSGLSIRDLATEAYDAAPREFRDQLDSTAATIHALIPRVLDRIRDAVRSGDPESLAHECAGTSKLLKGLIDAMSAIVNGEKTAIDQAGIDALLDV